MRAREGIRYAPLVLLLLGLVAVCVPMPEPLARAELAQTLWLLVQAGTLLLVPGLALILVLRPLDDLDGPQTLSLAAITSLALFPLLLFWAGLAGGRWNAAWVRALLVAGGALIAWRWPRRARRGQPPSPLAPLPGGEGDRLSSLTPLPSEEDRVRGSGLALAGIFALALAVRLLLIRQLAYPSWVDSYHHTIITQIILETGRVPANYYPYADLDRFLYHFGYHADSAFLAWATGLPAHRAVLWGGQVLNALTVLSLFFLVDRLVKDRRAALVAALCAGLLCRMPAYYVNWGRYTQLAGQLLFPVALAVAAEAVLRPQPSWRALLLAGLLAGGLAFTHYRVFLFYFVGMILLAGVALWRERRGARRLAGQVLHLGTIGLIALALVWPWLPALLAKTVSTAQQVLATSDGGQYDYLTLEFVLGYGLRRGELIAALLAALWLLGRARHRPLGPLVLLWLGLIFFLANPVVSRMPSGFMPNGTVIVGLYLPAAVLMGLAAGDIGKQVAKALRGSRTLKICASLGLALLALWGAQDMLAHTLEPWYQLVTPADERAMAWVEAHTPPEAVFAVGADFWLPSAATGSDAGYWLPYIARRRTIVPPMIYISEGDPSYVAEKQALLAPLASSTTPQELVDALRRSGATYLYVSNRTPRPWQASLDEAAYLERLYEAEGVRVYHLR